MKLANRIYKSSKIVRAIVYAIVFAVVSLGFLIGCLLWYAIRPVAALAQILMGTTKDALHELKRV